MKFLKFLLSLAVIVVLFYFAVGGSNAQITSCTGTYLLTVTEMNNPNGGNLSCPRCAIRIVPSEPISRDQPWTITVDGQTVTNVITSAPSNAPITFFWAEVPASVPGGARPATNRQVMVYVTQGSKQFCGTVRIAQSNPVISTWASGVVCCYYQFPVPTGPLIATEQPPVPLSGQTTKLLLRAWSVGQKYLAPGATIRVYIGDTPHDGYVSHNGFPGGYDVTVDLNANLQQPGSHQIWLYNGAWFSGALPALNFALN